VTADVGRKEEARRVFAAAVEQYGGVDLLVNNAARLASADFLNLDEEEYSLSFEKNVRIMYELSYLTARHMAESGGGSIVNISSVGGLRAHRGKAGYDASKGAMDALTRCMAVDLAPKGIRVNGIAPGATSRPRDLDRAGREERVREMTEGIPLHRMGTPLDIGAAVAFVASDAGSYITGQTIYVDGGLTAQLTPPGIYI
jgi:NAD(P)-dependent dehydrogenase (short-subunit alcohol dehydrogenase family)